jgi:hypothetical protein
MEDLDFVNRTDGRCGSAAEEPMVRGLTAGGNRIRTIGPAVEETPFPTPGISFRANGSDLRHSLRGTEGSNPLPSSSESSANPLFSKSVAQFTRKA